MTNWQSNPISTAISQEYMNDADFDIHSITPDADSRVFKSILPPFETAPKDVKSRIPSLEVEINLERNTFVTNGNVEGKLKITCYKEGICKLGRILVYLVGIEENLTAKKPKPRLFLSKYWILQDLHLVPSDSVYAGTPDEHGMWKAKYGTMTYDFSIPFNLQREENIHNIKTEILPINPLPSSYWHDKAGGIRYFIAGIVESKQGMVPRDPLAAYKQLQVYESVPYSMTNNYELSERSVVSVEKTESIPNGLFGLGKKLKLTARTSVCTRTLHEDEKPGVIESGSTCFLHVDIKNETVKRINKIDLELIRKIRTFSCESPTENAAFTPVSFSKRTVVKKVYEYRKTKINSALDILNRTEKSEIASLEWQTADWDGIEAEDTKIVVLDLAIPLSARTIHNSNLIDVSYIIAASIWIGGKRLEMDIPITIYHPASFLKDVPQAKRIAKSSLDLVSDEVAEMLERKSPPLFDDRTAMRPSEVTLKDQADERKHGGTVKSMSFLKPEAAGRRPTIKSPSPASMKAHTLQNIPYPLSNAPSIIRKSNSKVIEGTNPLYDNLEGTPTMDLGQEIDKLFSCVQMD
ncbi:hypothetical protein HDV06_005643 [Boothiomyces sp. JEL0866]|nr:hypothetical protein HDV06_005643 [Boothiomyces sp. JEL0866]